MTRSPSSASSPNAGMGRLPWLPLSSQKLVEISRESGIGDPGQCVVLLQFLVAGRRLRSNLMAVLLEHGLSEASFNTLINLFALDPAPETPANLAQLAQVSRPAMTDTIEVLHCAGWVARKRSTSDRRSQSVRLTTRGRNLVLTVVPRFLSRLHQFADGIECANQAALDHACAGLLRQLEPARA